jgi:hypothetical protein
MTKQEFLNGVSFKVKGFSEYKGGSTFKYGIGCIVEENRSSIDDRVIITTHHCNVVKIGSKSFTGFTYIMGKRVNVKYRYEDLVVFNVQLD